MNTKHQFSSDVADGTATPAGGPVPLTLSTISVEIQQTTTDKDKANL
jgi:hypothetical protein